MGRILLDDIRRSIQNTIWNTYILKVKFAMIISIYPLTQSLSNQSVLLSLIISIFWNFCFSVYISVWLRVHSSLIMKEHIWNTTQNPSFSLAHSNWIIDNVYNNVLPTAFSEGPNKIDGIQWGSNGTKIVLMLMDNFSFCISFNIFAEQMIRYLIDGILSSIAALKFSLLDRHSCLNWFHAI